MCGIAGIMTFTSKQVQPRELRLLTDAIAHRGPDGEGHWIHQYGNLGLGHRRLAILDLSDQGAQPMHYAGDKITIVYNGDIFNFAELRYELEKKGYSFRSDTDTEVLMTAYHAWGRECLYKLKWFLGFCNMG